MDLVIGGRMENIIVSQILANAGSIVLYVLAGLGSLVTLASVIVKATPSKDDDAFLEKLRAKPVIGQVINIVEKFSLIKRDDDSAATKKLEENQNSTNT